MFPNNDKQSPVSGDTSVKSETNTTNTRGGGGGVRKSARTSLCHHVDSPSKKPRLQLQQKHSTKRRSCKWLNCSWTSHCDMEEMAQHLFDGHISVQPYIDFRTRQISFWWTKGPHLHSRLESENQFVCLWNGCSNYGKFLNFKALQDHCLAEHLKGFAGFTELQGQEQEIDLQNLAEQVEQMDIDESLASYNDSSSISTIIQDIDLFSEIDPNFALLTSPEDGSLILPAPAQYCGTLMKLYSKDMEEKLDILLGTPLETPACDSIIPSEFGPLCEIPDFSKHNLVHDLFFKKDGRFYVPFESNIHTSELIGINITEGEKVLLQLRWHPYNANLKDEWIDASQVNRNIIKVVPTLEIQEMWK